MARFNSVQLRTTYNQSLGDAYNIEGFTPSGGSPRQIRIPKAGLVYVFVDGVPEYSEGQDRYNTASGHGFAGKEMVTYTSPLMHPDTYNWLKNNYRGMVSACIRKDSTTYETVNAVLRLSRSRNTDHPNWFTVRWEFTIEETL